MRGGGAVRPGDSLTFGFGGCIVLGCVLQVNAGLRMWSVERGDGVVRDLIGLCV